MSEQAIVAIIVGGMFAIVFMVALYTHKSAIDDHERRIEKLENQ